MTAFTKFAKANAPAKILVDKDIAGVKKGQLMYVGTPQIVDAYIRNIPQGRYCSIEFLRADMARRHACDTMCPVTTPVFIRMSAENALAAMAEGASLSAITPFWRVVAPGSRIASNLNIENEWIALQCAFEQINHG